MAEQISRVRWSDHALWRAGAIAALVILLLLLPIALGMQPLGTPAFDLAPQPPAPLPF